MSEKLSDFLEDMALMHEFTSGDVEYPRKFREAARIVRAVEDAPEGFWCEAMPAYICLPRNWIDIARRYTDGQRVRLVEVE